MASSITEQHIRLGNMNATIRAYKKLTRIFHIPLFEACIKEADTNLGLLTNNPPADIKTHAKQQTHWSNYKATYEQLLVIMDEQVKDLDSFNLETDDKRPSAASPEINHWIDGRAEVLRGRIQAYSKAVFELAGKFDPEHKERMMNHPAMKMYLDGTAEQLFQISAKMWKDDEIWDAGKKIVEKMCLKE
jgi:hypothetical protein